MSEPIPSGSWRTGRSWGRTIVLVADAPPEEGGGRDGDLLLGYAKGPDAKRNAQIVCDAVNEGRRLADSRWWCSGCLVYDAQRPRLLTANWILALDSPELARRIVAAVNGQVSSA